MWELVFLVVGVLIGGGLGWLWGARRSGLGREQAFADLSSRLAVAERLSQELRDQLDQRRETIDTVRAQLDEERQSRTRLETQLQHSTRQFEEQKRTLDEAEKKLKESFEALSARALQTNAKQFLEQAQRTLNTVLVDAKGDLGKRQEAINNLVKPITETLKRYEEQVQLLEQNRQKAYGSLAEQVRTLTSTNEQLRQETGRLVTSLRDPKVRGRWGEIALRRAAELAGLSDHVDFEQQVSLAGGDEGRFRPDMIVRLPGGRTVVIDAKAVLDAYLDAVAATDDTTRQAQLNRHAQQIRTRIRELSSKSYWDKLDTTPEFVVLFLPAESFFSAAVEMDRTLIEDAIQSRVVLASPTTLIALLKAIAFGWRQEQIAENARHISELGRVLFDRMRVLADNFSKVGTNLDRAVGAYNQAVGSLEGRVLPSARRFRELGAAGGDDIAELRPIERTPRALDASRMENGEEESER